MKDLITNVLLAGFGAMVLTKEKGEEIMGELIQKGSVSRDEAKAIMDSLVERGEKEKKGFLESMRVEVRKVIEEMGIPSKQEFDELKKRIQALEGQGK